MKERKLFLTATKEKLIIAKDKTVLKGNFWLFAVYGERIKYTASAYSFVEDFLFFIKLE